MGSLKINDILYLKYDPDLSQKFANLISKLNFYKLIPYPMDNSLSGRRRPARQTSEKDVLCLHWQVGP